MNRVSGQAMLAGALTVGLLSMSCTARETDLRRRMEAYEPEERVRAIVAVAAAGDMSMLSALVDRLDDEDPAVRLYAILALEELTDTRHGYTYTGSMVARRQAIERWRRFLREQAAGPIDLVVEPTSEPSSQSGNQVGNTERG